MANEEPPNFMTLGVSYAFIFGFVFTGRSGLNGATVVA
ncbi:hypothetical protein K788_0005649 [Paraburkholderia caribensis MBA4]|uniref:Uncharacterized protein n=1 Tax=Paraburkholderia caribensis MBA4 TaxID=1323664 RepID=A0A0N7JUA1_9BURK|nr:hypothetical protein K788_0005649 [Paraburkholderia caribensis MBA4]